MPTSCSSSSARSCACCLAHLQMDEQRLHDLLADRQDRVERGHRLLEDHRDVAAAQFAHLLVGEFEQVAAFEQHAARRHPAGGLGQQPHDGERRHRLAAAGLADDGDDLAAVDGVGNAVDRAHDAARRVELDVQVLHRQQRRIRSAACEPFSGNVSPGLGGRHFSCCGFGYSRSAHARPPACCSKRGRVGAIAALLVRRDGLSHSRVGLAPSPVAVRDEGRSRRADYSHDELHSPTLPTAGRGDRRRAAVPSCTARKECARLRRSRAGSPRYARRAAATGRSAAIGARSITIGVRTPGMVPPLAAALGRSSFMPRCDHLRVGEHLVERVDRSGRHADRFELGQEVVALRWCRSEPMSRATSASRLASRSCCPCSPGSAPASGSPSTPHSFTNWLSLPVAMMMWPSATGNTW